MRCEPCGCSSLGMSDRVVRLAVRAAAHARPSALAGATLAAAVAFAIIAAGCTSHAQPCFAVAGSQRRLPKLAVPVRVVTLLPGLAGEARGLAANGVLRRRLHTRNTERL